MPRQCQMSCMCEYDCANARARKKICVVMSDSCVICVVVRILCCMLVTQLHRRKTEGHWYCCLPAYRMPCSTSHVSNVASLVCNAVVCCHCAKQVQCRRPHNAQWRKPCLSQAFAHPLNQMMKLLTLCLCARPRAPVKFVSRLATRGTKTNKKQN